MASHQFDSVGRHPLPVTTTVDGCSSFLPGIILASSGATRDLAMLAADLADAPLLPFAEPADRIAERAGDNLTALIVADPIAIHGTEFPWTLQALTARGIRYGVLLVTGEARDRTICRKILRSAPLSPNGDAF